MSALPELKDRAVAAPDRGTFLATYGHLFEHSPWVVEAAWQARPFADAAALHVAFMTALDAAPEDRQRALVAAHPELGSRRLLAAGLTASSAAEQAGAGLDAMSEADYDAFDRLNAEYRQRFGFPFVICVRLTDRAGIEAAMRRRVANSAETELREALVQIGHIAHLRLADIDGLAAHDARVAHDLACLAFPGPWLPPVEAPDGSVALDVAIIGGGQGGLAAAFGLLREGIANIRVFDENPEGAEGPWVTYARMITLRTPKHLTPIDFGIPSLTFRAWWEAQHGAEGWNALDKIRRQDWMRYLGWYRRVLDIPMENDARVVALEPVSGRFLHKLTFADGRVLYARKAVLATGIQGGGAWHVPDFIAANLPPSLYAHTSQAIDFAALAGKRVAVLGGGASAFDNAQHALGEGAGAVDIYVRRPQLPQVNPIRYMEKSGILRNFPALDDMRKYRVVDHFLRHAQPPTLDTYRRATAYPGCRLHLGQGWAAVAPNPDGDGVRLTLTDGSTAEADFLIVSTGLRNDLALRPELAAYAPGIVLWHDRVALPPAEANPVLDAHPYLGPDFSFTPRDAEAAAALHGLFVFNYSALASLGLSASALSGLKLALPRLVTGLVEQLFLDMQDRLIGDYLGYADVEFSAQ